MKKSLTNMEYRNNKAFSRSDLFKLSKSPAHFKYYLENPEPETPALAFGTAFHTYVLEPDKFSDEYIIVPSFDARTKEGKAIKAKIIESGKIMLNVKDFERIEAMSASVMNNKYAAALISKGEHEQSYFWKDKLTGLNLKCRTDCRTDLKTVSVIADLKTTENAETESFMRACIKYGYDLQAAMYTHGVEMIEKKPHRFVFIAVEKSPPYACNVLEADDFIIKKGMRDLKDYLYTLADCLKTDNWYGYNGKDGGPNIVTLPSWLAREYE